MIAPGYDAELDELRRIATHTDEFLLDLERRERERTGLASLKLGYNRVQGFFIEVARRDAERVPQRLHPPPDGEVGRALHHRGAEELRGSGARARERALARERQLYEAVLTQLIDALGPLQDSAAALAEIDALAALAERAAALEWCLPGAHQPRRA